MARGFNRLTKAPFSTRDFYGYAGVSMTMDRHRFTVAGTAENFALDAHTLRNVFGGYAQWTYAIDDRSRVNLSVQGTNLQYKGFSVSAVPFGPLVIQDVRNADRYVFSIGYIRALRGAAQPVIYTSAYGGMENENNNLFPQFGHDLAGGRVGGSVQLPSIHRNVRGFMSMNFEYRDYHGPNTLFLINRNDYQFIASFGLECKILKDWRVIPEVSIISNDSNVPINEYGRVIAGVRVRFNF